VREHISAGDHWQQFDGLGRFIIADYDHQRPFSSFLPGIAGLSGIPLWVFYVNRAQAVCCFGSEDKDHAILEFQTANNAYQHTGRGGFRTFLNHNRNGERWHREVFSPWNAVDVRRKMFIGTNEVEIQEVNARFGYQVNVLYFLLPNLPFGSLVRKVTIKNLSNQVLDLEVLDGLPAIVPYGISDGELKHIGRTIEAWMQVENIENQIPYYRIRATAGDTAEVHTIQAGNYALAFSEGDLLPAVADPSNIFGLDTSQEGAHLFKEQGLDTVFSKPQILEGRSLCAFFGASLMLKPGEEQTITSLYGFTLSLSLINSRLGARVSDGYIDQKLAEARGLTAELTKPLKTESSIETFDGYCRQTFLDNVIRGGYPLVLGGRHIYHVYSRKHGDIERDYNFFVIPPEYYSQGNGNYRDVNQNRRNDVFFVPAAGAFNIRLFMSLIQSDGYNPLVISSVTFSLQEDQVESLLKLVRHQEHLEEVLRREFTPGEVLEAAMKAETVPDLEDFFSRVFSLAESHIQAKHGEGFWIDHWTYNLDLLEAYLAVFPDKKTELLFYSDPLPFYDNAHVVQPREVRFVLSGGNPRQLTAVIEDPEKVSLIHSRGEQCWWARSDHGRGDIFYLPLCSKLVLLALIKFATRDPSGMGIQMEAGRPGWYDALNGLPGLFGSSMPETYELLRLVNFLLEVQGEDLKNVSLPVEAQILLEAIRGVPDDTEDMFALWEKMTDALESYRQSTRLGFDGEKIIVNIKPFLLIMRDSLKKGIETAHAFTGDVPPTYFIHEVTDYVLKHERDANGNSLIEVKAFKPIPLPAFLEGPVRLMKVLEREKVVDLAQAVKQSDLFDTKLSMYKINTSLQGQSYEIGRARAFTPGWLENESIWMHMAFKYLLELLNAGLYDAFFNALKDHLPPFMDSKTYGRSILENSSFIVSSEHPDRNLHGNGFVARLSGSTAEFLSMWVRMTAGERPFRLQGEQLVLHFHPTLPAWMFDDEDCFTFRFLDSCQITVHNPMRLDTYAEGVETEKITLHSGNELVTIDGSIIGSPYAERIRQGDFVSIELYLTMR